MESKRPPILCPAWEADSTRQQNVLASIQILSFTHLSILISIIAYTSVKRGAGHATRLLNE